MDECKVHTGFVHGDVHTPGQDGRVLGLVIFSTT